VTGGRRFSQAISEGDGISVVVAVDTPDAARRAEADGAEAVLVQGGFAERLEQIRAETSLPILFAYDGEPADLLAGADACILEVRRRERLEQARLELSEEYELAFRIEHEDHLEEILEEFDPELFVLASGGDSEATGLARVLDLLPDVPAGKLAIAELPVATREEVDELERAGVDAVIVRGGNVAELVGGAPPEV
jgi:NAD(P)H-dependent flavin oxidoreductase YrpB (nitropropane dioxygenase family)